MVRDSNLKRLRENSDATPYFDTIVKIANILNVGLDELAGRKESSEKPTVHNPDLHRLYLKVDQLSDEDQQVLYVLLDSLLKRSSMMEVMTEQ